MRKITFIAAILALTACSTKTIKIGGEDVGSIVLTAPEGVSCSYAMEKVDSTTWKATYTFKAKTDVDSVRLLVDFVVPEKASWWMIPSVSYNGNQWGRGLEPKGASVDGEWWTFSYRRTPIPGAVYSETSKFALATWSEVPTCADEDFSCSVMPDSALTTHRLIWPEEEMPKFYCSRDKYKDGYRKSASMKAGEEKTIVMYINAVPVKPSHMAMHSFLSTCWKSMPKPDVPTVDPDTIWNRGIDYFKQSLWAEEGVFTGFSIGLHPDKDGWHQRTGGRYEAGWCGQNISVAISMLEDFKKNADQESFDKGLKTLDCWAKYCPLPNGLFIVHLDDVINHDSNTIIDACNLGTAALNYIEAYSVTKSMGIDRPDYLSIAYAVCDFVLADQQENGCYARGWYQNGESYVREGTIGCFMVPAMVAAWKQSRDGKYLHSAQKAFDYYYQELLDNGYSTAGALDTWCIDKESSITLLRSSIRLYEITKEQKYLDAAVHVSYYLSTWLWHYDGVYPADDNMTIYQWHTFGATSVSTQHNHLDFYAAYWIPEWMELSDLTGDPQWREKAIAIWNNVCQLISDGTLVINGKTRPRGSQNEAYYESAWGFDDSPERINNWLVAWPGAFRLETLRHVESF